MWLRLLALASVCAGCSASEVIYVDERFSPREAAAIQEGANAWTEADPNVSFDLVFGARVWVGVARRQIFRVDAADVARCGCLGDEIKHHTLFGTHDRETFLIAPDGRTLAEVTTIAAHEFGHSLGLAHLPPESPAIMNAPSTQTAVTAADLDELARVVGR